MDELVARLVAIKNEVAARDTHPEPALVSDRQRAAILIEQVKEIMNHFSSEDHLLARIQALESHLNDAAPMQPVPLAADESLDTLPLPAEPEPEPEPEPPTLPLDDE